MGRKYHVYIEAQAGFRQHMGTVDNIFVLHGLITHLLNNNKKLYAGFVDFTKAFDYLIRDVIWFKLIRYGVRGKMLDVCSQHMAPGNVKLVQAQTSQGTNSHLGRVEPRRIISCAL